MNREQQDIEWKSQWKDEQLKWICGFANAQGGTICIGVDDDGHVVGIDNAKKLLDDIPNKVRDVLGIIVEINVRDEEGKEYLEIKVPPYQNPINYKGQYFYRSGSTMQELKGNALNEFLMKRNGRRWEDELVKGVAADDLSGDAFRRFKQAAARTHRVDDGVLDDSRETLLSDLRLMDDETKLLKRAGVLLFHPDPEKYVFGAYIKIGFFSDDDGNLVSQDEVHGALMEQVVKALELIRSKYLVYRISYDGLSRVETSQLPFEALRESLMNAVAHKDYSSGIPIQIAVYPNRITFWNPGQLPVTWTVQRLFKVHHSAPYNPLIANAFFRSGDIESWGRGYRRIMASLSAHKLLPPHMTVDDGVAITYYPDVAIQLGAMGVEERAIKVIEFAIENQRVTNSDVQNLLGVSKPTATRVLKSLGDWLEVSGKAGAGTSYRPKWLSQ